jgi:predicted NUDIX family phosphoesterase
VQIARCETPDVSVRETDMLEGSFVSLATLRKLAETERDRLETWSALIIDQLEAALG